MKKVFVVQLADSKKPVFPKACALCGIPGTEPLVPFTVDNEAAHVDYYLYGLSKRNPDTSCDPSFFSIPAHHNCLKKVRYILLKRLFLILLAGSSVAVIGMVIGISLLLSLTAAVILTIPVLYFEFTKPLPVQYHHYPRKYVFCFTDGRYAEEFARFNNARVQEGDYIEHFEAPLYKKN